MFSVSAIIMIIIAPRLLPIGRRPAVGFGPKLKEMNPRTFPDLPICPRTLRFCPENMKYNHQTILKKRNKNSEQSRIIAVYYPIMLIPGLLIKEKPDKTVQSLPSKNTENDGGTQAGVWAPPKKLKQIATTVDGKQKPP